MAPRSAKGKARRGGQGAGAAEFAFRSFPRRRESRTAEEKAGFAGIFALGSRSRDGAARHAAGNERSLEPDLRFYMNAQCSRAMHTRNPLTWLKADCSLSPTQ
jgi:hypothetical protein